MRDVRTACSLILTIVAHASCWKDYRSCDDVMRDGGTDGEYVIFLPPNNVGINVYCHGKFMSFNRCPCNSM